MNELSLFTGAGGGVLGSLLLGWRTVCGVEIDPYCREVLLRRQEEGNLHPFPIWDDIKTFDGTVWRGRVDVVTAGFPCQPFSVAGQRKGEADERNLWPDTIRVIREVGPRFALLENVPGLLAHEYFGTILGDLAESGFDAEWCVLSAAEVGAPHIRDRLWVFAYPTSIGWDLCGDRSLERNDHEPAWVDEENIEGWFGHATQTGRYSTRDRWEAITSRIQRSDDDLADHMDRLRSIGNGQVPAVVVAAWRLLGESR